MNLRRTAIRVFRRRPPLLAVAAITAAALLRYAPTYLSAQTPQIAAAQPPSVATLDRCLASGTARAARDGRTGGIRFIGTMAGQPIPHPEPASAAASPEAAARAYLAVCGSLVGLTDQASELAMTASTQADGARRIVRFRQHQDGIPIVGAELIVNLDRTGNIMALSGETRRSSPLNTIPGIDAGSAAQTALDLVADAYAVDRARLTVSPPELWIYDPSLIGPERGPTRLVWRMNVTPNVLEPIRELVLVDAERGSVALHFNQVETARNRNTHTANNTTTLPGSLVCDEANPTCSVGDADAVAAHVYAGDTYNFYLTNFGRDSLNNAGMTLVSTVHYGPTNYQNAFWNGQQMAYGNGFSLGDDVVGHELTHGVTDFTSNLFYYYQSGAINESFSDVFGELIDQTNGTANDTPAVRWLLGEEIGTIRNMQNPPALGDPDRMTSALYYTGAGDNGGVHTNSGINNKAASLMVDGGTFNGQAMSALGALKVAKIYYEAQTHLLTSGADYADLFEALYQACNNLVGVATTSADCQQVRNATLAVEMHLQPVAGFNPEAPLCSPGQLPVTTFFENFEGPSASFTVSATVGTPRWVPAQFYAHSGSRSLWANDLPAAVTDTSAAFASDVAVPANAFLHFAHAFEFQGPNSDGGVLEYSTNAGATWSDAAPLLDTNGYRGTIAPGSNPLTGRAAFVDASHGYISTRANLGSLAGQNVRFRWRMGLDATTGVWGWWLDDVRLYTCSGLGITTVTPSSSPQGLANLSVGVTGQATHFVQGQTIATFGPGVVVHGTTVIDETHAAVHVSVPSDATVGTRDVLLTTGTEVAAGPNMFGVTPGASLTRITPNRAQPGQQNLTVDISATLAHFLQGQTVVSFGAGVTVASTRVIDANHVAANLFIAPDAPLGPRTVMVTTGNELLQLTNGFIVRKLPLPTQRSIYALGKRTASGYNPQTVSVIDANSNAFVAAIPIGRGCFCVGSDGITVAPDGATAYVTNDGDDTISIIDTTTNTVSGTVGISDPAALAVSPDSTRLYVLSGFNPATLHVVDTSTRAILASIPLGVIQAYGMALTPDGSRLYMSTYGSNSVKVVDTTSYTVMATIPVGVLPLAVDASSDGASIYVTNLTCANSSCTPGSVSIISTATNSVVGTVNVGTLPYDAKATPDSSRAYLLSSSGVAVINAATRTPSGTVPGTAFAWTLAFSPDSNRAYVSAGPVVQLVDTTTNTLEGSIPVNTDQLGIMMSMAASPGPIRGIALGGDLDFGTVPVGGRATRALIITNTGNSPLAVSSLAFPAGFSATFAGASIAAAGSQQVMVTFAPARAGAHGGTITAAGNQTLGRSTIAVSGYGATDATRDTDFDRDTGTDIAVYRPSVGAWFILRSGTAFTGGLGYSWGVSTDIPMPGDYDGDGRTDIAVYRPSTGHWFILKSSSNYTVSATYQWGTTGDLPMPGDFDGDGRSDLAVYRPSTGAWYALLSSTGYAGGVGYLWGTAGDVPVPGDYDGDGRTDIAVYRGSSGHWFILRSSSNYSTWGTYQWGTLGDMPMFGDYDGDSRRDLAVFRPSTGAWYILRSSSGFTAGAGYTWGASTDVPVPGDYDGDGITDLAVYRVMSSGLWYVLKSSSGYTVGAAYQWGTAGDIPVVRQR